MQKLDRLTQEESKTAATLPLEVVHDLAKNLKVVMDCELLPFDSLSTVNRAERFHPDEITSADHIRQVICKLLHSQKFARLTVLVSFVAIFGQQRG